MAGAGTPQRGPTRQTIMDLSWPLGPYCDGNPGLDLVAGHRRIIQHGLRPAILGPAGGLVAHGNWTLLAVGNRLDACGVHPLARQEGLDRHRSLGTEGEVVLPRPALVGVAFDRHPILRVLVEPARLMAEDAAGFPAKRRAVLLEM